MVQRMLTDGFTVEQSDVGSLNYFTGGFFESWYLYVFSLISVFLTVRFSDLMLGRYISGFQRSGNEEERELFHKQIFTLDFSSVSFL